MQDETMLLQVHAQEHRLAGSRLRSRPPKSASRLDIRNAVIEEDGRRLASHDAKMTLLLDQSSIPFT